MVNDNPTHRQAGSLPELNASPWGLRELPGLTRAVRVRDTRDAPDRDGNPPSRVAALIHDLYSDSEVWANVVPDMVAAGWRVVALDLDGHGDGRRDLGRRFSFQAYAEHLEDVLRRLDVTDALVCGHGMGGLAALEMERSNLRVRGLVLVGAAARFRLPWQHLPAKLRDFAARREVERLIAAHLRRTPVNRDAFAALTRLDPVTVANAAVAVGMDHRSRFAQVRVPVGVLMTKADTSVPLADQVALVDSLPEALTWLAAVNAGHLIGEQPDLINGPLLELLAEVWRMATEGGVR